MKLPSFLLFASDATIIALCGGALLAVSGVALWGERQRKKRRNIDAVGLMPWRDIAAITLFGGMVLLAMAISGWMHP